MNGPRRVVMGMFCTWPCIFNIISPSVQLIFDTESLTAEAGSALGKGILAPFPADWSLGGAETMEIQLHFLDIADTWRPPRSRLPPSPSLPICDRENSRNARIDRGSCRCPRDPSMMVMGMQP